MSLAILMWEYFIWKSYQPYANPDLNNTKVSGAAFPRENGNKKCSFYSDTQNGACAVRETNTEQNREVSLKKAVCPPSLSAAIGDQEQKTAVLVNHVANG